MLNLFQHTSGGGVVSAEVLITDLVETHEGS
jgi:hypothetical protein